MAQQRVDPRCKAQTKSGKRCRAAATTSGLCFFHANPNKASELGRVGGRSKRGGAGEIVDPLPALDNAIAVREVGARLFADVYTGKLHPRIAAGLVPLMNLQLRAIETANLEQRVARLEKLLADAERDVDDNPKAPELDFGNLPMSKA
jgi:hypothetical protein